MLISVQSGGFKKIIQTSDRRFGHRMGCIQAIQSGKKLSTFITSSVLLDCKNSSEEESDCLCTLTNGLLMELKEGEIE